MGYPTGAMSLKDFAIDFALGGVSGAVAKTLTAPIERIKLVIQTQDANPKIRSGEVPRYTGIGDCGARIMKEQGVRRFWDGNLTNCIRYFPTQAFNLAFKDTFKKTFPKYNPKTEFAQFFGANLVSGGLAAAGSLTIVYPLDYSRTRLASDVGSGKKTFSGLFDCMKKTAAGPGGFMARLFRHNHWPQPLQERQGDFGRRVHLCCSANCDHHRCWSHLPIRYRPSTLADAVGETS